MLKEKIFKNILMDFIFLGMHVFGVLNGLIAIFCEDIQVEQLLCLYFI